MTSYDSPRERLRAIYQVPASRQVYSVLELSFGAQPKVLDQHWPAQNRVFCQLLADECDGGGLPRPMEGEGLRHCSAPFSTVLPFPEQSFDQVILHFTLDDIAFRCIKAAARVSLESWLKGIVEVLVPGGLLVGCAHNRSSPRYWIRRIYRAVEEHSSGGAPFGVGSCGRVLGKAGLQDVQVFNLIPHADTPRTIISVHPHLSRRAFYQELQASRNTFCFPAYFLRRIVVAASLNRYLEETLFFWGRKPC